ncbi:glycosyltransferase [Vogesella indigofera]|uniref:glycosyltransferase n=1 Tax=Vogesella indigofera TaxID=45465 RepID=UPI00234DEBC0|nr:glycosyltransferase [Vogesella indigofera]MDC7705875.1 glycosyltransferase [Vogesella indigofera]
MSKIPSIAIVCDWLESYAGAERVIEEIINIFPQAEIFAVVDFVAKEDRGFLKDKPVKTTFIQKLPFARKFYRHYLPLMPFAIEQLDLRNYDIIISSSHAVAKGIITSPDQLHVSYIHSPLRYAWDMQNEYLEQSGIRSGIKSCLIRYLLHKIRIWDVTSAQRIDHIIANSRFIAKRIKKVYNRTADVIYPPVDISTFQPGTKNRKNYYITVSRLVGYKKIELIIDAFRNLPDEKIIIVGDGPEKKKLMENLPGNVTLLGFQPQEKITSLLQEAKAFIFAAREDFGIAPVEAQACGTPVIAFNAGGAMETIVNIDRENPTGILYELQNKESIINAIQIFNKNLEKITSENCRNQAEKFSSATFRENMKNYIEKSWKTHIAN